MLFAGGTGLAGTNWLCSIVPRLKQARVQMSLWAMMAAPLILSMNVRNLSAFDLETYGKRSRN